MLLDNFDVEMENDDSGLVVSFFILYLKVVWHSIFKYFYYKFSVFTEDEIMTIDVCLDYCDSKSLDKQSSQPTLATVLELFGYTY